jgi:hypothetical protein
MKSLILATAAAAMLALGSAANAAQQIASPIIFGNHFQELAECVVLNAGSKPLSVGVKIINDAGDTVATSSCDGPLGAAEFCSLTTAIDFQNSFACVATASSTTNLRGTLILDQTVFDDFLVPNLHPIRAAALE